MHTNESLAALKRTELQALCCRELGKQSASWVGHATNAELRDALASGVQPARFANGSGNPFDLAAAIATAVQPFIESQLNEVRVGDRGGGLPAGRADRRLRVQSERRDEAASGVRPRRGAGGRAGRHHAAGSKRGRPRLAERG